MAPIDKDRIWETSQRLEVFIRTLRIVDTYVEAKHLHIILILFYFTDHSRPILALEAEMALL